MAAGALDNRKWVSAVWFGAARNERPRYIGEFSPPLRDALPKAKRQLAVHQSQSAVHQGFAHMFEESGIAGHSDSLPQTGFLIEAIQFDPIEIEP